MLRFIVLSVKKHSPVQQDELKHLHVVEGRGDGMRCANKFMQWESKKPFDTGFTVRRTCGRDS